MRWIACDSPQPPKADLGCPWSELSLPDPWPAVLQVLSPSPIARPIQRVAVRDAQLLETRRNVLIAAPTNSGKSLIATLLLLDALRHGRRAVLLEPLRALARERYDELHRKARPLGKALGRPIRVRLATGDIRREDESLLDGPPTQGELIIATPERLEALLRQPAHDPWLDTIGMVAVDEAHLLSSPRRGPTLEHLLTTFLTRPSPPRLALLSATLGDTDTLRTWLQPCDLVQTTHRWPPLTQRVCALEDGEDATEALKAIACEVLADPEARLLIFVYQTRTTEKLAKSLPDARAYHAQLTPAVQNTIREAFHEGTCRCVIATTALAQGVNLPATHVIVFETTFPGVGPLRGGDLLQMTGRAGRGDRAGQATVLVRPTDAWSPEALAQLLRTEQATEPAPRREPDSPDSISIRVAAYLARQPQPVTAEQVRTFFTRSLNGATWSAQVPGGLSWLADPGRTLAHADEDGRYRLTALGETVTRAVLPLPLASGFAQLLRDLLQLDPDDRLLSQWKPLDFLVVLHLLQSSLPKLRPYSAALVERVDSWMEAHPEAIPMLYREWLSGTVESSRAREVLGSLGTGAGKPLEAHKQAYSALFHAIVLWERGQGRSMEDITRAFKVEDFSGVEDRWRDECLWLLTGLSKLLEVRCFYFHLKEACRANADRIKRVKGEWLRWRRLLWEVEGAIIYCSPLGGVLQQLRRLSGKRSGRKIGVQMIRRLEAAGITNVAQLEELSLADARMLGLTDSYLAQLQSYLQHIRV